MPSGDKAAVDRLDGLENETNRSPNATTSENAVFTRCKSS
jgi:hypothetical protein